MAAHSTKSQTTKSSKKKKKQSVSKTKSSHLTKRKLTALEAKQKKRAAIAKARATRSNHFAFSQDVRFMNNLLCSIAKESDTNNEQSSEKAASM